MTYNIKSFQKRYALGNKDIADICNCSLPTIQKWRSGEVSVSGAASQLMKLLDLSSEGDPKSLRELLGRMNQPIESALIEGDPELEDLESSMSKVVDRLEYMLESRRKDKELSESEARYRSMVDSYANPICRWLPDTTLTFVNDAYSRLFSKHGENLVGRKWIEFVPEENRHSYMVVISDMIRRGDEEVGIHELLNGEGREIQIEWRDIPVKNAAGIVVELHSVGYDVTELVELRRTKDECRQTKNAFMELTNNPVVIFNDEGSFIEKNDQFRQVVVPGKECSGLGDMLPGPILGKFKRLLKRIRGREAFCFQLKLDDRGYRLNGRLLARSKSGSKYLAQFEELSELKNQLIQVRLRNEIIVDGKLHELHIRKETVHIIEKRMNELGNAVDVDRVYVFTFDWEDKVFNNILEWCAQGVESHIDDLQQFPISEYPWWTDRMLKNQWIQYEDTSKMPRSAFREREVLVAQGISSIMVAPVVVNDITIGFVGFDHNHTERIWHEQEQKFLDTFKSEIENLLEEGLQKN